MTPTTQDFGPCPCHIEAAEERVVKAAQHARGCGIEGTKLTKYGHLVGCTCRPCLGRRNKRKGYKAEARGHKRLGGQGGTVRDDLFHAYSLNHSVEVKTGAQIPSRVTSFLSSEWYAHAIRQAEKKIPVGSDALPSVLLEISPSKAYLVTDVSGRELRT